MAADHVRAVDDGGSARLQHGQQALSLGPLRLSHSKCRAFAASGCRSAVCPHGTVRECLRQPMAVF